MPRIILGLGSNLDDRLAHLRDAIRGIRRVARVRRISPVYESDALTPSGAPESWKLPFYNLALEAETDEEPLALLSRVKMLEKQLGRTAAEHWAPRVIDIDLLWADGKTIHSPELTLPHPELVNRPFALLPLLDITSSVPEEFHAAASTWMSGDLDVVPFRTRRARASLCQLIGIVNVTPDSFSDGGLTALPDSACLRAEKLLTEGATVLDIGAESTRPGATPLSEDEEWRRLAPALSLILPLLREKRAELSLDTRRPGVARRALGIAAAVLPAESIWINDVSGLEVSNVPDPRCKFVVMHSLSVPADPRVTLPRASDPVAIVGDWFRAKLEELGHAGLSPEQMVFDPGVGFGKTAGQSLRLLRGLGELRSRGRIDSHGSSLMVGHSRKSFIASFTGSFTAGTVGGSETPAERDLETAVAAAILAEKGVEYLRVHHVQASLRAILAGAQLR